ncbi:hypothetical protein Pcar_3298 [Syntrophotalea carbinolica DSM 2380]|uniref:Uncharacterized protein n=1 Tax=Syntrophotalea carbinolica (strain DSM 2380 / NBRC 103641 / GraBd1) TaxID=338963 RepID=Q0C6M0_SYNC1|nr:hypothetical protein Pcar_3298 [Syntrophotalea carbinolica DSM 2380]
MLHGALPPTSPKCTWPQNSENQKIFKMAQTMLKQRKSTEKCYLCSGKRYDQGKISDRSEWGGNNRITRNYGAFLLPQITIFNFTYYNVTT